MINITYKTQINKNFCLDVEMALPDKGITVLFGPSGSGKTCLLNLIAGLDRYNKNIIHSNFNLNDKVIDDSNNRIKLKPWLRKVAYVFQDNRLFPHMNTLKNILFGFKRCNSNLSVDELVKIFNLQDLLTHFPSELSGGQKQRVSMVRALLSQPELLILDEPLAALDYQSKQSLLPYIDSVHKILNIPMIYVSHDIKEVLRLADYVVVMDKGKIIDQGDIAKLCISQPLLTQQEGASFILEGKVSEIYETDKLVQIDCKEKILITAENMHVNQQVRLLIHARDVSLCLTPPQDSSILNCIPIVINKLQSDNNSKLRVMATMGGQTIVALISHRSAHQLQVESGREMFAQFKATAMIK